MRSRRVDLKILFLLVIVFSLSWCGNSNTTDHGGNYAVPIDQGEGGEGDDDGDSGDEGEDDDSAIDDDDVTDEEDGFELGVVEKVWLGEQLQTYCRACHAVGKKRFIESDDPVEIVDFLLEQKNPDANELWVDSIVKSLSWPEGVMPPARAEREPKKEWMPIGKKRHDLNRAKLEDGTFARNDMVRIITNLKDLFPSE